MTKKTGFKCASIAVTFLLLLTHCFASANKEFDSAVYLPTRNLSPFFAIAKLRERKPKVVMGSGGPVTEGESWGR